LYNLMITDRFIMRSIFQTYSVNYTHCQLLLCVQIQAHFFSLQTAQLLYDTFIPHNCWVATLTSATVNELRDPSICPLAVASLATAWMNLIILIVRRKVHTLWKHAVVVTKMRARWSQWFWKFYLPSKYSMIKRQQGKWEGDFCWQDNGIQLAARENKRDWWVWRCMNMIYVYIYILIGTHEH